MGKRLHGEFFCEEIEAEHPVEGCNYLLALDMEMDPIPGYEIASWERGYGDFALAPGSRDAAADSLARGDRARPLRRPVARRLAGRAVAAPGAEGAAGAGRRARLCADDRLRARVLSPARELRGGVGAAVRGPDAVRPVHPRLPRPRDDLRRGPHPPDPQRDARRRDQGRDLEGRGVARPARDQLPLRRRADDGRQPRDLQERRQGDRAPERLLDHVHGEAVRELDRELVPHPLRRSSATASLRSPTTTRSSTAGSRARSRASRSSRSSSPRPSTRTSASPPEAGRRRRSPGGTTTARAGSASSGTARRSASRRRIPGGDVNPYLAFAAIIAAGLHGIENELELPPALEGNAYESDAKRFPSTLREAIAALEVGNGRARRVRRPGRRPLPELRAHRAGALRQGRHRLGARPLLRARLTGQTVAHAAGDRDHDLRAGGDLGRLAHARGAHPARLRGRGRAGGRTRRCWCRRARTASTETLDALDGIVFSGGADVDPSMYGAEAHPETDTPQARRDAGELALLTAALERDMPTLAICRGVPAPERRPRRRPRPAPPRGGRARRAQAGSRRVRGAPGRGEGGHAARRDRRRALRRHLAPPPGAREARRRARRDGVGRTTGRSRASRTRRSASRSACSGTRRWGEDGALFEALVEEARAYRAARRAQ